MLIHSKKIFIFLKTGVSNRATFNSVGQPCTTWPNLTIQPQPPRTHFYPPLLKCSRLAVRLSKPFCWLSTSPDRYVLIFQSNIESGPKIIQFNIQFKTKFEIFIQSKIHSKISLKYSIQNFIQEIGKKWFKMSTWYKCSRKGKKLPSPSNWLFHCCHVNPYLGTWGTLITM